MSQQGADGKFPWESAVPEGEFWKDLPEHIGRQALRAWSAEELAAFQLDERADASPNAKLEILKLMLHDLKATKPLGNPENLSHHDFESVWHRREYLLAHVERELGMSQESADRSRYMIHMWAARDDPLKKWAVDMSAMDMLLVALKNAGRYDEAEEVGWGLIKATVECPDLGYESAPHCGIMKKQMNTLLKLGKYDEGLALNADGYKVVEAMAKSRYAKYEEEMLVDLGKIKNELEQAKLSRA